MTATVEADQRRRALPGWVRSPILVAAVLSVALIVVGELVSPGFGSYGQVVAMLRVAAFLGLIAVGQTIVILSGGAGIDLSVGKVATLAAIIASRVMQGDDAQTASGILLALAVCALIGLANGLGVVYLRITPFVMTLGMMGVVHGLILAYTGGVADGRAAPALVSLVNGRVFANIPGVVLIWVVVTVLVTLLLRRTKPGWDLYAVGANRVSAELSGVRVNRTVVGAYVASACFAGLGGIFMVGYTQTVFLNLADDLTLPSIAAVIIGGTLLSGGVGGYVGSAIGAVVLTVLTNLLTTLRMGEASRTVVNGLVLIILLAFYGRGRRLRS
ncbi:ABC transporter permease [Tessaracoccus oleiagri]|uniref:Autoinducer 2 import system permease protein LsrD n=1 Tax=Tessaracoccus oleiagri TaxID=686624 RepID=A0A1G9J7N1_9ACTN|nr:ABC transporter permease [Tessaracoccus oleiagri]SDL33312.1 monosaccharide ABC transporter membrane protein, CUT2 family [Tessaracoccus oleiagri]